MKYEIELNKTHKQWSYTN